MELSEAASREDFDTAGSTVREPAPQLEQRMFEGGALDRLPLPPSPVSEPQLRVTEADESGAELFALAGGASGLDPLLHETTQHLHSLGRVNILLAGQTGVGKSTLVNAVFGEEFAKTAAGRPVTQHAEWFASDRVPLRILDTKGLEAKAYEETLQDIRWAIETCRSEKEAKNQLHMAWVCIAVPSSRVQDAEIDLIRVLNKYNIPVIVVLTKDDDDPDFPDIVARILAERRVEAAGIVPVRAVVRPRRPPTGLKELAIETYRALPAAHRAAFAAAQKVNRDINREAAEEYVTGATAAAAAAAAIPIPVADVASLVPIQAGMLIAVSATFGLALDHGQVLRLVRTTLGCLAISLAGRWVVGSALKLIPGAGSVIGAALNAAVAGAVTRAVGKAYISFLYTFIEQHGRVPSAEEIFDIFPGFYKNGK